MLTRQRIPSFVTALAIAAASLTAWSSVEIYPPIDRCHDFRVNSNYGKFLIQQGARGNSIQWGTYPRTDLSGTSYIETVYVDGKRYDHKDQSYPPHGSVDAGTAAANSEELLSIEGRVERGGELVLVFTMQCRIMVLMDGSLPDFWDRLGRDVTSAGKELTGGVYCLSTHRWLAGGGPGGRPKALRVKATS